MPVYAVSDSRSQLHGACKTSQAQQQLSDMIGGVIMPVAFGLWRLGWQTLDPLGTPVTLCSLRRGHE